MEELEVSEITKNENGTTEEELHKLISRKFGKRKIYTSFKDNIWGADLADMKLINKFNKWIPFLLCVIDIHCKYAWVVPLVNFTIDHWNHDYKIII